jgi:hypothetical protein
VFIGVIKSTKPVVVILFEENHSYYTTFQEKDFPPIIRRSIDVKTWDNWRNQTWKPWLKQIITTESEESFKPVKRSATAKHIDTEKSTKKAKKSVQSSDDDEENNNKEEEEDEAEEEEQDEQSD